AGIGHFRAEAEPETAAHRRPVVHGVEGDEGMRPLSHVLAVLVGDADVVEADAVRAPGMVQLLVEGDEVDGAFPNISRDVSRVQSLRDVDRRPPTHAMSLQPGNDLTQDEVEIATNDAVVAAHAMAEFARDVAVWLGPSREVPDIPSRDRAQVERVLARVKAQRDHA